MSNSLFDILLSFQYYQEVPTAGQSVLTKIIHIFTNKLH